MSDFDDLISSVVDTLDPTSTRESDERRRQLERLRASGEAAARASAGRGGLLADRLSHLPSDASPFDVEGARGIQFLRRHEGLFARFDYCVRLDLPGVLPRFVMHSLGRAGDDDATTGPRQRFRHKGLELWTSARSKAPDVLRAFDVDVIGDDIRQFSFRVALVPQQQRLSVLEVDIGVGDGRQCERAAEKALQFAQIAANLVQSGATFAERSDDGRPAAEQVEDLVQRLSESVSWLSGPVARIGDGVEGRLALDEQQELPCSLRIDLDNKGQATLYFRGPLQAAPEKRTTLSPQETFLDRLRGLVDERIGAPALDDAWVIDGVASDARRIGAAEGELVRLRRLQGTIELGPEGLVVRVPSFELDNQSLLDAAGSALSMWRTIVRRGHGLAD